MRLVMHSLYVFGLITTLMACSGAKFSGALGGLGGKSDAGSTPPPAAPATNPDGTPITPGTGGTDPDKNPDGTPKTDPNQPGGGGTNPDGTPINPGTQTPGGTTPPGGTTNPDGTPTTPGSTPPGGAITPTTDPNAPGQDPECASKGTCEPVQQPDTCIYFGIGCTNVPTNPNDPSQNGPSQKN